MTTVRRYDRTTLRTDGKRTPQGYLLCDAAIARTGVQVYRMPDGTSRREYRSPEEVFHPDALQSFALAPLTLGHPQELVTAENNEKYSRGIVAAPKQDGHLVRATVQLMHPDAIKAAESGSAVELSCGYLCDLDMTPGVVPAGQRDAGQHFDCSQKTIRGNHVAQLPRGRAGPEARLRMDAADAEQIEPITPEPARPAPSHEDKPTMEKLTVDGVEIEVSTFAAQIIRKARKDAEEKAANIATAHATAISAADKLVKDAHAATVTARADADANKAKFDAAEAARVIAEKARTDAVAPEAVAALVAARVEIETKARAVLGNDAKLAGKTPLVIKKDCLMKLDPAIKLDGVTDAYIDGAFDYTFAAFAKQNPAAVARAGVLAPPAVDKDGRRVDENEPKDPRAEYMANQNKADEASPLPGVRR